MVGVIPSIAAFIFLMIIGCKKAMELILSGKTIGARDALEEGVKGEPMKSLGMVQLRCGSTHIERMNEGKAKTAQ